MIPCGTVAVGFPLLFGVLFLRLTTLGVIFPNATAMAMQPFSAEAGSASAFVCRPLLPRRRNQFGGLRDGRGRLLGGVVQANLPTTAEGLVDFN